MGRRTPEQLAHSRSQILSAAEYWFAEKGFAHTQIAEIAGRAGIGIGAFYRQFNDKEDVLRQIVEGLFSDLRQQLLAARSGLAQRTPIEQITVIRKTFDIVFEVFAAHPAVTLTMLRNGYGMTRDVETLVWNFLDELARDIAADIERAVQAGVMRVARPLNFGDATVGAVVQLARRMLIDGKPTPAEAAAFCTRFAIGSYIPFMSQEIFERISPLIFGIEDERPKADNFPGGYSVNEATLD